MSQAQPILTPQDQGLDELCDLLATHAGSTDQHGEWPALQLARCAACGVYRWFLPPTDGGLGWDEPDLMRGYVRLGAACLTTTFVITQASGALCRFAASGSDQLKKSLLPALVAGELFTTLGISHLTTSRRHLARPALHAQELPGGFRLDGFSPWVTGALHADWIVIGAQLDDGRQLLAAMPTDLPGVSCDPPVKLVALSASHTGTVRFADVKLDHEWLLAGPAEDIMQGAIGAKTGGLQNLGAGDSTGEPGDCVPGSRGRPPWGSGGGRRVLCATNTCDLSMLFTAGGWRASLQQRTLAPDSNSLALRAAQAALVAAKGTGYMQGHPVGRWCREALFFLVWSCPQQVATANLCELAGIVGEE